MVALLTFRHAHLFFEKFKIDYCFSKYQKGLYIADFAVEKILKATSKHEFKFSGENDSKNGSI